MDTDVITYTEKKKKKAVAAIFKNNILQQHSEKKIHTKYKTQKNYELVHLWNHELGSAF